MLFKKILLEKKERMLHFLFFFVVNTDVFV